MPSTRSISLRELWQENLRPSLHNPANWYANCDYLCRLVYVATGAGFSGSEEMKQFFKVNDLSLFGNYDGIEEVECFVDEESGKVFDEFILNWTQKRSRMEWMLPGTDFPLQKYRLSFTISAQIDCSSGLLKNCRVYWDQGSLLLQSGVLMKSLRSLIRPNNSEMLESTLTSLLHNDYRSLLTGSKVITEPVKIGALNNFSSILGDLPQSTSGPAVMTPQRPTRSKSLNPALLGTLKLGDYESTFDSPQPANTRNVKSRNIFFEDLQEQPKQQQFKTVNLFDQMNTNSIENFKPTLAANSNSLKNNQSEIFNENSVKNDFHTSLQINETFSHQYESKIFADNRSVDNNIKNLPQTDKILFESHVFDSIKDDTIADSIKIIHNATAPPQCPSHLILNPEEDSTTTKITPNTSSQIRPGMLGHFRGASLGDTSNEPIKFVPSTAIRFDPNRSQIILGDESCD